MDISLPAEKLFNVGPLPVTNSFLTTYVVMAVLFVLAYFFTQNLKKKPGRLQLAAELIVGGLHSFFENLGGTHGKEFGQLAVTIFLFVVVSNWFGLLPGVGTIGFYETVHKTEAVQAERTETVVSEHSEGVKEEAPTAESKEVEEKKFIPLFRAPTSDLSTTLALAIVAVGAIQYYGLKISGVKYLKKFFDVSNPINFFVGILEFVSDISKILSFGFRLFGNVFAGEVLLAVMAYLFAFLLPVPFYGLELFVGVIQALVFAMLTIVFLSIAVSHGHSDAKHEEAVEVKE